MDIYVGNLPYSMDEDTLTEVFSTYGEVEQVKIIMDRQTGRSKGFGFVTMNDQEAAQAAIEAVDGSDIGGRPAKVNAARQREDRPPRGDFGGGGFRRGGGGGDRRGGGGGDRRGGGYRDDSRGRRRF